jgi:hypothetical protein
MLLDPEGVSDDPDLSDCESGIISTDCCTECGFKCRTLRQQLVEMSREAPVMQCKILLLGGARPGKAEQKQGETRLVLRRSSQLESANNSNLHVIRIDCTLPPALLSSIPGAIQLPELHDVYSGWNLANMRAMRQFGTRLGP